MTVNISAAKPDPVPFGEVCQALDLPGGLRTTFAQFGDPGGQPVLALHGTPACRLMFASADEPARRLGLRLIAPDRPGYGRTPPSGLRDLQAQTAWLRAFVDAAALDRFAILSISGGAPFGVALSAALGLRITALALVSPMGPIAECDQDTTGKTGRVSRWHRHFFLGLGPRFGLTRPVATGLAALFRRHPRPFLSLAHRLAAPADAGLFRRTDMKAYLTGMTREALRQGGAAPAADLRIFSQPWAVAYDRIAASAVLWIGTDDRVVPIPAAHWLAHHLPRCRVETLPGQGHFWVFDHAEDVLASLRDLMQT